MEQQQQQQYENTASVPDGSSGIQQKIKNSLSLIIRIFARVQMVLSIIIFAMEIGIIACYYLFASTEIYGENAAIVVGPLTAAGIWTSIVMDIAIFFLFRLVKQTSEQRMWIINVITQSVLFLFTIILIGITGDYVTKHRAASVLYCSSDLTDLDISYEYQCTKYQLHQAQLAFAILMFFSALLFIGLFLYLYFIVGSFPSPIITRINSSNNNDNPGVQQPRSWSAAPPPPPPPPQLTPINVTLVAQTSGSVLKEIKCPHCGTTLPLPIPKGTYNPTQQLYMEESSYW